MQNDVLITNSHRFEDDVLKSSLPVALFFYKEDCVQSENFTRLFDECAEKWAGKMQFVRIVANYNTDIVEKYKVVQTPALMFFSEGAEVCNRYYGSIPLHVLKEAIETLLGKSCHATTHNIVNCDVLILGAGPAGLTASIYSARNKLYTVVLETAVSGGLVASTYHIANYPGTDGTVKGWDLMENMKKTALSFGATIKELQEIKEVDFSSETKRVKTADATYHANAVILATGAVPRALPVSSESQLRGKGIHYCATCDGPFYSNANLFVVGGGTSALEETMYLTKYAKSITIVNKNPTFKASRGYIDEALNHPKVSVLYNSEITQVFGDEFVTSVEILDKTKNEKYTRDVDGIFVYIGLLPNTSLFRDFIGTTPAGYIAVTPDMTTTNPGVFAAGDVIDKSIRQITTAVGDGTIAGISAGNYLLKNKEL